MAVELSGMTGGVDLRWPDSLDESIENTLHAVFKIMRAKDPNYFSVALPGSELSGPLMWTLQTTEDRDALVCDGRLRTARTCYQVIENLEPETWKTPPPVTKISSPTVVDYPAKNTNYSAGVSAGLDMAVMRNFGESMEMLSESMARTLIVHPTHLSRKVSFAKEISADPENKSLKIKSAKIKSAKIKSAKIKSSKTIRWRATHVATLPSQDPPFLEL
jgi:hypothetical protein